MLKNIYTNKSGLIQKNFNTALFFILINLLINTSIFSDDIDRHGNYNINNFVRSVKVYLESNSLIYNKKNNIEIKVNIENTSHLAFQFFHSTQNTLSNYKLIITDASNGNQVKQKLDLNNLENEELGPEIVNTQGQFIKEIILGPNETYQKKININKYFDLEEGKNYRIWVNFYPSPNDNLHSNLFIRSSNHLNLHIAKSKNGSPKNLFKESNEMAFIDPKETVYLYLTAVKDKNYSSYIKYLDLRKFIEAYPLFYSKYQLATNQEKEDILAEFRVYLTFENNSTIKYFKIIDSSPIQNKENQELENLYNTEIENNNENLNYKKNENNNENLNYKKNENNYENLNYKKSENNYENLNNENYKKTYSENQTEFPNYQVKAKVYRVSKSLSANYEYTFTLKYIENPIPSYKIIFVNVNILPK